MTKLAGDVEHQAQRLHDFHKFWVTATTKAMAKSDNQHNSTTQTTPTFDEFFSRQPCTYPFHNLGDDVGDDAPFGKEFTDRFLQWFQHVGFIDNVPDEQASSLLELYVSFALSTGTMTPVYVRAFKKKTKARPSAYVLRENSLAADTSAADLNGQLRIFVQFMKWVSSHLHAFSFVCTRGGLRRLGYLSATTYISGQFVVPNRHEVCTALWEYFHQGRRSTYNLKAAWRPGVKVRHTDEPYGS